MKHYSIISLSLCSFLCVTSLAQQASQLVVYNEPGNHSRYVKSLLSLENAHDMVFWPLFDQYAEKLELIRSKRHISSQRLLEDYGNATPDQLNAHLQANLEDALLRKEYFQKALSSTNGVVALQFLQGEELFELLGQLSLFENVSRDLPRWDVALTKNESEKIQLFTNFLEVAAGERDQLRTLLEDFEFDMSRVVGHEHFFFEQYIEDCSDFVPGHCKKLGVAFAEMNVNEERTKQRYFEKLLQSFGVHAAVKFVVLQEYFSLMSKLSVWSSSTAEK
jgi:hypothetical protein